MDIPANSVPIGALEGPRGPYNPYPMRRWTAFQDSVDEKALLHVVDHGGKLVHRNGETASSRGQRAWRQRRTSRERPSGGLPEGLLRRPPAVPNIATVILRSPLLFQIPDVPLFDMYNVIHYIWKYQIGGQPEGSG